ncbi:ester cyclase [Prauserella rugosa]|uniref:SnoaL-like protein n=1 Tax=Prauserella rugosa TaxID=43354 RepID=A0A660CL74_9PSEU|nr:nuclear transport factor 2 family protein [Prauserella rugosa]KMS72003.1 polyketide cyclase [Streptomyces regensis]TWH21795.1 SnoaL-like protein [Prauserella rugosa]
MDLYRRWLGELWNGPLTDLESIARRVVTDDFVGHWPGRPKFVTGPDELAAVIRQGREMFDDLTFEVAIGPVSEGDLVTARWLGRGHYEGTPASFHGHDILRRDGDRFVEYWVIAETP